MPGTIDTFMLRPSFHVWLEHRLEEVPDSANLALVIARSGGISRDDLSKIVQIPRHPRNLLRALITAGQVMVLKVNGQMVFPRGDVTQPSPRKVRSPLPTYLHGVREWILLVERSLVDPAVLDSYERAFQQGLED